MVVVTSPTASSTVIFFESPLVLAWLSSSSSNPKWKNDLLYFFASNYNLFLNIRIIVWFEFKKHCGKYCCHHKNKDKNRISVSDVSQVLNLSGENGYFVSNKLLIIEVYLAYSLNEMVQNWTTDKEQNRIKPTLKTKALIKVSPILQLKDELTKWDEF